MQINIPDHILLEDSYVLVINKPCGLMVEPDRNNHPNLLQQVKTYIKSTLPKGEEVYAQHIHRLDRPVSGIVLFAKQRKVLKNLSEQFAERRVKKFYQALTAKSPKEKKGRLENWHRKEKKKAVIYTEEQPYSERAILNYRVERISENRFLWDIELHTGKFHQIRAQLANEACPVIGDVKYGSDITYKPDSIALRAYRLIFYHPITDEEIVVESKAEFVY